MFLTQTQGQALMAKQSRKNSLSYARPLSRSKSAISKKFQKMSETNVNFNASIKKNFELKKTLNMTDFSRKTSSINPQKKWNKIVDLYNMPCKESESQQTQLKLIRPGLAFYRLLANGQMLKKHKLKINFPETFLQMSGDIILVKTNQMTGQLQSHKIQREKYSAKIAQTLEWHTQFLKQQKKKYKSHYDYRQNQHAPVVVTKISEDFDIQFEVDVQSYKNFDERRTKPSSNKIVQRFIYPRSMQATILRVCYHRKQLGQQREEYFAYRFQNVDNIFRVNKKNNQIYETFKLQSTICAAYDRQNKIQFCRLSNLKGLQKYIQPSKQLISFLEKSQKIRINKINIDFIIDLFDIPWLINLKQISYEQNKSMGCQPYDISNCQSLHIAGSYGICRLCSSQYLKKQLRQSISNKMLIQFLSHMKKRMKVSEYESIEFVKDIIQTKTKNYITLQVCKLCYQIVAEEYKLIDQQQKLAKICNISPQLQMMESGSKPLNLPDKLKQWRLMLYFVGISNIPAEVLKGQDQVQLKYRLGNGDSVEHNWNLRVSQKTNSNNFHGNFKVQLNIKKVKIHYFYSESLDIDNFLKQTQINFQLAGLLDQKIFAKGSSGTLSTFRRQFHNDLCLRQTSSVLLFYSNGKYCEMTIKVGLICDGMYQISDSISLAPLNKVYFADNQFTNSNSIPRQWMEAFGVNQQTTMSDQFFDEKQKIKQESIFQINMDTKNTQSKIRNKLSRKSLNLYR